MGSHESIAATALMVMVSAAALVLPGWLAATVLRVRARWCAAFVLGSLVLFWNVMAATALGFGVRFVPVLVLQVAVSVTCVVLLLRRRGWRAGLEAARPSAILRPQALPPRLLLPLGVAVLVFLALLLRLWVQPLMGFDIPLRWNLLAAQMLDLKTLEFYPPVSAHDFEVYTFPDSIPPLVSALYWWFYAAVGAVNFRLATCVVATQGAVIAGLVYLLGSRLGSRNSGIYAVAALASAPLAFSSVVIGQETGLLVISVLALFYYLVPGSDGGWSLGGVVMGGCAVALGALAREYGWAYLALGWLLLIRRRAPLGYQALFGLTAIVIAGPWYVRTWALTGNPLFPVRLTDWFPVNPVYAYFLDFFALTRGTSAYSPHNWRELALAACGLAPLQAVALVVGWGDRRLRPLLIGATLVVLLWVASISFTFGGAGYSMRVLGPAVALLSVGFGGAVGTIRWRRFQWPVSAVLVLLIARALVFDVLFPYSPSDVPTRDWGRRILHTSEFQYRRTDLDRFVARRLAPGVRVLTHNPYEHAQLMGSANPSVIVWSPEVRFLFDHDLDGGEMRRRLLEAGIGGVLYSAPGQSEPKLDISPLYRDDRASWVFLEQVATDSVLYALPPDP